ncbi:MAG: cytochrome c biogenesis CcdA family protein, partial [Solirubrobacterales bacterium]
MTDGAMLESPNIAIAFAAGFVSFVSPCCLPLVPGYLAAVTGGDLEDIESLGRGRIFMRSLVFVSTFSLIFILFGLGATAAGAFLFDNQETLNLVAGIVIVAMGIYFLAALAFPRINMEFRSRELAERAGNGGPIVAGAAFAVAWTPCVGPTLGAILGLAATTQGTAQGG